MDFDLIQYYCREKYYHTMLVIAESLLKNQPDNIVFKLQYCSALIFENRIGEALRELEILTDNQDVGLAVIIIMIYAQDLCEVNIITIIYKNLFRVNFYLRLCFRYRMVNS